MSDQLLGGAIVDILRDLARHRVAAGEGSAGIQPHKTDTHAEDVEVTHQRTQPRPFRGEAAP